MDPPLTPAPAGAGDESPAAARLFRLMRRAESLVGSAGFWWVVCLLWAAIAAWADRHTVKPDGLSYLDMASEALNGGARNLINGYWSPLYPALLAAGLWMLRPSPESELPAAHLVNVLIYLLVLLGFTFFLRAWLARRPGSGTGSEEKAPHMVPFGFGLFLWFTSSYVSVGSVGADLCVAGIVFLAAGVCCRLSAAGSSWRDCVALGGVLGLGYYAKGAMFPLGLLLLAALFLWPPSPSLTRGRILLSALVFLIVSAPLAGLVSARVGHLTVGETGPLNYLWNVNRFQEYAGWTGKAGGGHGAPEHPPRTLIERPLTLEFSSPVGGTYPLWYDPSYWYAGAKARFQLADQIAALKRGVEFYARGGMEMGAVVAGALVLCVLLVRRKMLSLPDRTFRWLLAWPVAACLLYALVRTEPRYVAAFLALFWLAVYGFLLPRVNQAARAAIVATVIGALLIRSAGGLAETAVGAAQDAMRGVRPDHMLVAEALREAGVKPGDRLATVGYGFKAYYARVAGARVVANILEPEELWRLSAPEFQKVTERLAGIGVKALVAQDRPRESALEGWQDVAGTRASRFSILVLKSPGSA